MAKSAPSSASGTSGTRAQPISLKKKQERRRIKKKNHQNQPLKEESVAVRTKPAGQQASFFAQQIAASTEMSALEREEYKVKYK